MIDKLQAFGLSDKESKVYFASLELGKATADQIAKQAGVIRSTSYTQIESLMKQGLMSTFEEGKKTYFVPESPENLTRILERQSAEIELKKKEIGAHLPGLLDLFGSAGERPAVRFFEGKEGLITMRADILTMKGKELCVTLDYDDFCRVFSDEKERNAFTKARQKKGIKTRMLYTTNSQDEQNEFSPEESRRVSEEDFPIEFVTYVYDSKVVISSFKEDALWGIVIEGEAVAKSMKSMFEIAWAYTELKAKLK